MVDARTRRYGPLARDRGVPILLGEFFPGSIDAFDFYYRQFDENGWSWTGWTYKCWGSSGADRLWGWLRRATGSEVAIDTDPPGALVSIAGAVRGEAPVLSNVGCKGSEKVEVRAHKEGFRPVRRELSCREDTLVKLTLRLEQKGTIRAINLPGALVAGPLANGASQIVHRHPASRQRRRIGLDADRRLGAVNRHLTDAAQNADPLRDLGVAQIVQLSLRQAVTDQCHVQDRLIVRIGLGERRRAWKIDGQASRGATDRRLHIRRGGVDALGQGKLQREATEALRAPAGNQFQSGNLHELPFQRRSDVGGHGVRAGAGIANIDQNHRVIDRRQIVHRQLSVRQDTKQDCRHRQDHGHHGPANKRF
jgi:hypothetical protein